MLKSEAASPPEAKLRPLTLLVYAYSHANSSSTATCPSIVVVSHSNDRLETHLLCPDRVTNPSPSISKKAPAAGTDPFAGPCSLSLSLFSFNSLFSAAASTLSPRDAVQPQARFFLFPSSVSPRSIAITAERELRVYGRGRGVIALTVPGCSKERHGSSSFLLRLN